MDVQDFMIGRNYEHRLTFNAICVYKLTFMGIMVALIAKLVVFLDKHYLDKPGQTKIEKDN